MELRELLSDTSSCSDMFFRWTGVTGILARGEYQARGAGCRIAEGERELKANIRICSTNAIGSSTLLKRSLRQVHSPQQQLHRHARCCPGSATVRLREARCHVPDQRATSLDVQRGVWKTAVKRPLTKICGKHNLSTTTMSIPQQKP